MLQLRWHRRQWLWVASAGGDKLDPVEGGVGIQLKNNKKLAVGKGLQKIGKERKFLPALMVAASL